MSYRSSQSVRGTHLTINLVYTSLNPIKAAILLRGDRRFASIAVGVGSVNRLNGT